MAPGVIGICNQQAEVPVTTNLDHTVPWLLGGLQGDENQANRGESSTDHNSLQEAQRERIPVNKRVGQADWQDDSNPTSCLSGSIVVSRAPVPEEPHVAEVPVI